MNYRKNYMNLVMSRQLLGRKKLKKEELNYLYYESHHILPKCLGGTNDKDNLVLLTAKEHFIAHMLLTKCYEGETKRSMIFAFWNMQRKSKYHEDKIISAKKYDYVRNEIKEYLKSICKNIEKKFGSNNPATKFENREKISKALKGRKHTKEHIKKVINSRRKNGTLICSEETKKKISQSNKGKVNSAKTRKLLSNINSKPIYQFTLDGAFIKEWSSITLAQKSLIKGAIGDCLKGNTKTAGGYKWAFKKNFDEKIILRFKEENKKPHHSLGKAKPTLYKPIVQFSLTGERIAEYSSLKQAGEILNINPSLICGFLKGREKIAGGYFWAYKKNENTFDIKRHIKC